MQTLRIELNVVPPSGSKQSRVYTPSGISFPNKSLVKARHLYSMLADYKPTAPFDGPLSVRILFVRPLAKSDISTKAKRAAVELVEGVCRRFIWCVAKPDADNAAAILLDGLQRCNFFHDDKQIVDLRVLKVRAHSPKIVIEIECARDASQLDIEGVW